jgi:mRNA interferase RelE/StbE
VYRIHILDAAARELARLDKPVARRVVKRIKWLATNLDDLTPESLTGDLAGLYKLRVGDYRVLYGILHEEQAIVIFQECARLAPRPIPA